MLCASLLLVGIDLTVLHIAVPTISRQLLPDATQLLWIVDSYPLTVAALLVTFGTLADRWGRKRMVLGGFAVFGLASAGAAASATTVQLIVARAALGVGAAMMMAATVAVLRNVFPDRRERTLALGLWTSANSAGAALGPLLGGLLLRYWWWGAVFLVNVPVVVLALAAGARLIPESRDPAPRRWDGLSAAISILGLGALVFGLKRLAEPGTPDALGTTSGVLGLVLLGWFIRRQRRSTHPLLELSLFSDRRFSAATLAVFVCFGCYATLLYFATQLLQLVEGYSPLRAGLALAPLAVASGLGAVVAPRLAARWTHRWVIAGSLAAFAAAFAGLAGTLLSTARPGAPASAALLILAGLGAGMVMALGADAIMTTASADRAGQAGAIQETSFELGSGLGIAVLGSVLAVAYRLLLPGLPDGADARARDSLGATLDFADTLGTRAEPVRYAAQQAFAQGLAVAGLAAAGMLILSAGAAGVLLGRNRPDDPIRPARHSLAQRRCRRG
ncbi:MFS transporter [Amycolatopsis ultiminotia]|uniref:MFS transporter n=1 Tax=Amycolatopsis ultiminotia TaxID=543629 RepID=A0ABP6W8G2_9PSEU